jgi:hypothetical protein
VSDKRRVRPDIGRVADRVAGIGRTSEPAAPSGGEMEERQGGETAAQQDAEPASRNTSKTVERQADEASNQQAAVTPAPQDDKPAKAKLTHYVNEEAAEAVDKAHYLLRRMVPVKERGSISKSDIVEAALLAMIADLEANGAASEVARRVLGR